MNRILNRIVLTKIAISVFVVANLLTVLSINMPDSIQKAFHSHIKGCLSDWNAYRLDQANYRWRQYAYVVGLDNRWQMFGRQSRFNWWYDIRAVYSNGIVEKAILLPLPNQSQRSILERYVFDQKERKFALNIYQSELGREAYSRYLMRQFAEQDGMPIQSIRWHLCTQRILPPEEAVTKQELHEPKTQVYPLNDFLVPTAYGTGANDREKLVSLFKD